MKRSRNGKFREWAARDRGKTNKQVENTGLSPPGTVCGVVVLAKAVMSGH